ncbi:MAG: EF-P lysine aminoacylase EpmA [Candidatus Uhrbacteria bacterium]
MVESRKKLIIKARMDLYDTIRAFFRSRGYLEVETPLLVRSPGMEPNLDPFEVNGSQIADRGSYGLITSPEYSMKKLLGSGLDKIFTITKVFRSGDSETSQLHNPEFSMLEWYEQGIDYQAGMDQTEELVCACGLNLVWSRYRVRDLMLEHTQVDLDAAKRFDLLDACQRHGLSISEDDTESDLFYRLFLTKVEPELSKDSACIVYDYPVYQSGLAKLTSDGKYAQRFEVYLSGVELCNAFTELTDSDEQRDRFQIEAKEREHLGKQIWPIDEDLLSALSSIQNPTFGNALGLDRLLMLKLELDSIDQVLPFRF